jgi:hypothetical protein
MVADAARILAEARLERTRADPDPPLTTRLALP